MHEVVIKRGLGRGLKILTAKEQFIVTHLLDVFRPQPRLNGECPQRDIDHQGREIVQVKREQRAGTAIAVLVGLDADLEVPPADKRWNTHAVVVDQFQSPGRVDHHVGMLQITVGHGVVA